MKNKQMIVALLAGGLTLATDVQGGGPPETAPAQPPAQPGPPGNLRVQNSPAPRRPELGADHSYLSAAALIGRPVRDKLGESIGTVQDLIVNRDLDTVRVAIIKCGGTLGIGATHAAVPFQDLKWSGQDKVFSTAATKEQIRSASPIPTGGWAFAVNEQWARKVNRFYGDPWKFDVSELGRPGSAEPAGSREFVREALPPQPAIGPGNNRVADPGTKMPLAAMVADGDLLAQVNQVIIQFAAGGKVHAAVQKGVVTLVGKVPGPTQKQDLETRIKALNGVATLIDDHLAASND